MVSFKENLDQSSSQIGPRQIPGVRQLSRKNQLNQLQMNTQPYQQFDTYTSSHIRNFLMRLVATCKMTLYM